MISSTFLDQPGMKLELPEAKSSETLEQKDYILVISKEGHMYLNNAMVDIKDLEKKLKEALPQMKDQALILKADQNVTHGIVVRVMDTAKSCGIKKLIIGTRRDQ
jgi:biopolymer transport protein ExbD